MRKKPQKPPQKPQESVPQDDTELLRLRGVEDIEQAEDKILQEKLSGGPEFAGAYLYLIEPDEKNQLPAPIVGASTDFKKQMVRMMNARGLCALRILDTPPVIQDVVVDGKPAVRAIVGSKDYKTGEVYWAVKDEPRHSRYAATIALEKAIGKALEGHPAYNRKLVAEHIRRYLKGHGIDPKSVIIAGAARQGRWDSFFARAKQAGMSPDELRQAVRQKAGMGLSEATTPQQIGAVAQAADEAIAGRRGVDKLSTDAKNALNFQLDGGPHKGRTLGWCLENEPEYMRLLVRRLGEGRLAVKPHLEAAVRAIADLVPKGTQGDATAPPPEAKSDSDAEAALVRKRTFCGMILDKHKIPRKRLPADLTAHEADLIIASQTSAEEVNRVLDNCWAARGKPSMFQPSLFEV